MAEIHGTTSGSERPAPLFVRIPGPPEDLASDAVSINGHTMPMAELLTLLEAEAWTEYALLPCALNGALFNRADLHRAAATLFKKAASSGAQATEAAAALVELLAQRAAVPEAAFIGIQVLRLWSGLDTLRDHSARLIDSLAAALQELSLSADLSRRQLTDIRYVLLRAFESDTLHGAASIAIRKILASDNPRLVAERKDLASSVLSAASRLRVQSDQLTALKRLAAAVFATGTAPPSLRQAAAPEGQPKRITFLVTAQDAERRRQFGLASAIEIHKAATLIGRQMTLAEHELALTFHHGAEASVPGNQRWPSRDEWMTAQRLALLAAEELPGDTLAAAGLLYLLATKIKAEDPSDSRVSFKRPDALDYLTRRKSVKEAERIAATVGATAEQLELVSEEQSQRLLDPTFLVHNPIVVSLSQAAPAEGAGPDAAPRGGSAINLGTNELMSRLIRDNSPTLVSRLVAADFDVLKKAQGLDAEQFRILLERIRPRAITDPWARLAFLDIVRAPHADDVNVRVRTAALGALVNDARRLGKLTAALEKEVFAVSAEVPHLPNLARVDEGDDDADAAATLLG